MERPSLEKQKDMDRDSDRKFLASFPVISKKNDKDGCGKDRGFRKFVKCETGKSADRKRKSNDSPLDFTNQKGPRIIVTEPGRLKAMDGFVKPSGLLGSHKPTDYNDNSLLRKTDSGSVVTSGSAFKQVERTSPQTSIPSPSLPEMYPVQNPSHHHPYPYARLPASVPSVMETLPIVSSDEPMMTQSKLVSAFSPNHKSYLTQFPDPNLLRPPFIANHEAMSKLPVSPNSLEPRPFMPAPVHQDIWGLAPFGSRQPCTKPFSSPLENFAARRALQAWLPPNVAALTFQAQNWCAKCNTSFRMTSDLVYHMRSHHKSNNDVMKKKREDKLKCNICGETFRERHHMSRHMTSHM